MAPLLRRSRIGSSIPTSSMADIAFLLLIFFLVTTVFDEDKGLSLVLPETTIDVPAENILFLIVRRDGVVEVRRGENPQVQLARHSDVSAIWRAEAARNARLIAAVKTYPDAPYRHMIEVLDQLKTAGAERISLQLMQR